MQSMGKSCAVSHLCFLSHRPFVEEIGIDNCWTNNYLIYNDAVCLDPFTYQWYPASLPALPTASLFPPHTFLAVLLSILPITSFSAAFSLPAWEIGEVPIYRGSGLCMKPL